jgi:hypothetical protein
MGWKGVRGLQVSVSMWMNIAAKIKLIRMMISGPNSLNLIEYLCPKKRPKKRNAMVDS